MIVNYALRNFSSFYLKRSKSPLKGVQKHFCHRTWCWFCFDFTFIFYILSFFPSKIRGEKVMKGQNERQRKAPSRQDIIIFTLENFRQLTSSHNNGCCSLPLRTTREKHGIRIERTIISMIIKVEWESGKKIHQACIVYTLRITLKIESSFKEWDGKRKTWEEGWYEKRNEGEVDVEGGSLGKRKGRIKEEGALKWLTPSSLTITIISSCICNKIFSYFSGSMWLSSSRTVFTGREEKRKERYEREKEDESIWKRTGTSVRDECKRRRV